MRLGVPVQRRRAQPWPTEHVHGRDEAPADPGYIINDHWDRFPEFFERATEWVKEGRLRHRETVVEGIDNAPRAFLGLLRGENIGKMLVKVG